ncbi:CUB domain and C-type lectin domain and C-type lectin-like domain and C-type lectin fold domain-containing protein [Strongyloides ratti]|uniref:CUB domain and C-type lectin domain and C-type lectin-like domain and C-type lectin fold domain-containing protein n=1 Tax=Strongyloides ratti TaxID=34506 RepID=A0A090L7Y2_STRRB|nr:CUB domain and C-type lectin domain and C-type lectin-like domain and C-type lectin fold domain-containing protein [Strongyloides ratti]CEF64193.2 CUB domain and C-type lectin domain and C-type lectin-like domain and C-type lectin fold domain-containing protein [Strongyloides ratti]
MKYLIISFYFIFNLIYIVKTNDNQCIAGYTYYDNWCYKYYPISTISLSDAKEICAKDNGELPVIHNVMTNNFITDLITDSVWIGLTCDNKNICTWVDGTPYDYNNFQNGLPQVYIGNAVKLLIHHEQRNFNGLWISSSAANTNATTLCRMAAKINTQKCPLNYYYISNENNNCYKIVNDPDTFDNAAINCKNDGGNLISIHSLTENVEVLNFLQAKTNKNSAWIGLQYIDSNSVWLDGSSFDFNNYKKDFPNKVFGDGVEILLIQDDESFGFWENTRITNMLPYICKMTEDEVYNYNGGTTTVNPLATTLSPSNKCPTSPMYQNNGYINSPGYPSFYGNNIDCYYYLIAPKGSFIQFKIMDFNLDVGDSLNAYDGNDFNNIIKSLTGSDNTNAVGLILTTKYNNFMVLHFRSNANHITRNSGFNGYFTTYIKNLLTTPVPLPTTSIYVETTNSNECPSDVFTKNSEIITSPGYPKSFGANLLCTYLIEAPLGKNVALQLEKIHISQDEVSLEIYDGKGMSLNIIS